MPMNIAIDGPVGAGKSSIADQVAQRLHILHLDTGAMYRTVALYMLLTAFVYFYFRIAIKYDEMTVGKALAYPFDRSALRVAIGDYNIAQAEQFYEQDYYTPSDDGFKVFNTPFGRVGIVICYDRHLPESIRTCTLMGAQLVIIPTANTKAEPMEMFEWEIRVQAMQNQVFIAMCNRVGKEGDMDFAGESLVVHPSGDVICKADDKERLVCCEIDLAESNAWRAKKPYIPTRRPECYL